ncbi:MAG TPA: hypothetical protein DDY78_17695 [Planctomycetales bacterium]|jgi:hypothetical protein|nr:hypothetical protein [Planctomycetales bacterium]
MTKNQDNATGPKSDEGLNEQVGGVIDRAFQFFRDQFGHLTEGLNELDQKHREAKERISRGPGRRYRRDL